MKAEESLYPVALSFIKGLNGTKVKELISRSYTAEEILGVGGSNIPEMMWLSDSEREAALASARVEIEFMMRHNITPLYIEDPEYPICLVESGNPPIVLYMIGNTNLNPERSLSVVGTRKASPMGLTICKRLMEDVAVAFPGTLIVSGLAYGIDSEAHKGALEYGLPTVGVLAHGLDMLYPAAHRGLASTIIKKGGALLTEYPHGTRPHRNNFLERNRIVATMTNGVLLVESPERGGAMSTASIAFSYSREVMAIPGRPTDEKSRGCNSLIKANKAHLIENAQDVFKILNWESEETIDSVSIETTLFPELEGDVKKVYEYMKANGGPVSMDSIAHATSIPIFQVMTIMTDMEFDGLAVRHPGNRYEAIS